MAIFKEALSRDKKPQDFHLFRGIENKKKITLPTNSKKDGVSVYTWTSTIAWNSPFK